MVEIIINTEINDDWMKSLPGYAGEVAIHKMIAARLERRQRTARVADELGKKAEKHLRGQHDQKLHGAWASRRRVGEESGKYEDISRLKKIHYEETKSVNSTKLVDDGNWGHFIALNDGTFAHCAGPGYFYHTYLAAGRILSHPEKYEPEHIKRARRIIDGNYDEDLETESAVGEREQSLSFTRGISRSNGKPDVRMIVKGTGSTIFETKTEVVNRAFRLVKKLVKSGAFSGVDSFYFHGADLVFTPAQIEEISSISKLGIPHYKHLSGQHDQKLHGRWARGREDRQVGTSRVVGLSVYPQEYTDYGTSEAARNGLVNPIKSIQSRMDELDKNIKDCSVRIKKNKEEYFLILYKKGYATDEETRRTLYLNDQISEDFQSKIGYQKERAKLSKQRDELAKEWLEGMQAKNPLNPGVVLGNEEIEKYYLSIRNGSRNK